MFHVPSLGLLIWWKLFKLLTRVIIDYKLNFVVEIDLLSSFWINIFCFVFIHINCAKIAYNRNNPPETKKNFLPQTRTKL